MLKTKPIFEHERDVEFKAQVERLVESKLSEKVEAEKQKSAKEKLDEIRKGLKSAEHVHDFSADCPTCKGHTLQVKEDTAKCTGPNCGKEFLLVEKVKDIEKDKKKYICATCGYSVSKGEVEKIKSKDVCPSCGIGKAFFDLAWDKLESAAKNRSSFNKL